MTTHPVATSGSDRAGIMAGMACLDTSRNPRIPILMEMVAALSRADDPRGVLREFAEGFYRLNGPQGYVSLSTRGLAPGEYKITRMLVDEDDSAAKAIHQADPWHDWDTIPVQRGGIFGEIIRQAYPEIIHNLYLKGDPVVGDALAEYGSMMALPLFDEGEPLNWSITLRREAEGFTERELEEAILRSNLGGATVKNVMMTKQLREANEKIHAEVEQIARIQRALLPSALPEIPGIRIGANYQTYDRAGGDLYMVRPLASPWQVTQDSMNQPWAFLVADASGHGPAAAVVMAMLVAIIEAYPRIPRGPAEILQHANAHLFAKKIESSFATAFLGIFHPKSRLFTYARAGHNPPIHMVNQDGSWRMNRLEDVGSVPLGVLDHVTFEEATTRLDPGQTIVMYTDGITEAKSPKGDMFDVAGIERSLLQCSGEPDCVIGHVTGALLEHQGGLRPSDDQTLLVLRGQ